MKEPTYRQALAHAWQVVWQHKIIWIFGVLSIFLGQLGIADLIGKVWYTAQRSMTLQDYVRVWFNVEWPATIWAWVGLVWLGVIVLSVGIGVVFLSATGQGALISYVATCFKGSKRLKPDGDKAWRHGVTHFWNILGVNILRVLLVTALMLFFMLCLRFLFVSEGLVQSLAWALGLVLIVCLSVVIAILTVYTLCYIVVDDSDIASALQKAWRLFANHVLVSVEVGILLLLMNIVLVIGVVMAGFFAFLPSLVLWLVAGFANAANLIVIGFIVGVVLWLVLVVLVAGVFNAFTISAWVYLFMKMHKEGLVSRFLHMFKHFLS